MALNISALATTIARSLASSTAVSKTHYSTHFSPPDSSAATGKVEWYSWGTVKATYGLANPVTCYVVSGTEQSVVISGLMDSMTITLVANGNIGQALQLGTVTVDQADLISKLTVVLEARLTVRGSAVTTPRVIASPKVKVFLGLGDNKGGSEVDALKGFVNNFFPVKVDPAIFPVKPYFQFKDIPDDDLPCYAPIPLCGTDLTSIHTTLSSGLGAPYTTTLRHRGLLGVKMLQDASVSLTNMFTRADTQFSGTVAVTGITDYMGVDYSPAELASFNGLIYTHLPCGQGLLDPDQASETRYTMLSQGGVIDAYLRESSSLNGVSYSVTLTPTWWGNMATSFSRHNINLWSSVAPNAYGIATGSPVFVPELYDYTGAETPLSLNTSYNRGLVKRTPTTGDVYTALNNLAVVLDVGQAIQNISPDSGFIASDVDQDLALSNMENRLGRYLDQIRAIAPETPIILNLCINRTDDPTIPVTDTFLDLIFRQILPGRTIHGIIISGHIEEADDYVSLCSVLASHLVQLQLKGTAN